MPPETAAWSLLRGKSSLVRAIVLTRDVFHRQQRPTGSSKVFAKAVLRSAGSDKHLLAETFLSDTKGQQETQESLHGLFQAALAVTHTYSSVSKSLLPDCTTKLSVDRCPA